MIEKNRKTSLWMLVVLLLILGGFLVSDWGGRIANDRNHGVLRINGTSYTYDEFHRLGQAPVKIAMDLSQMGFGEIFALAPASSFGSQEGAEGFFANRILLREAKTKFGVQPGDEEISQFLKSLPAFNQGGTFNQAAYNNAVKYLREQLDLSENDLRELASDVIAIKKIREILGGGLYVDRKSVADMITFGRQQISVEVAPIEKAPLLDKVEIKDDELKSYWETLSDSFVTEPRRKFTYFIAAPEAVATPAPKEGEDASKADPAVLEQRKANERALAKKLNAFLEELSTGKGQDFEALAKKQGWEVKTTELITSAQAPADLLLKLRSESRNDSIVSKLFNIQLSDDVLSKFSDALPVGENQWLIARLDTEEASRKKTFDEARDQARKQLKQEKAQEALRQAATDAAKKIKEQLAAGKSFADAAKEAGLTSHAAAEPVSARSRKPQEGVPMNLFQNIVTTDPGTLAEPVVEADSATIVYVVKREVVKEDNTAFVDSQLNYAEKINQSAAFAAWLQEQLGNAKIEQLYKKR